MSEGGIFLRFEIAAGRFPAVENVSKALVAWADLLKATAEVVAPEQDLRIEIAGVEPGSQIFDFFVRTVEPALADLRRGSELLPETSKVMLTLGGLVATTAISVGLTVAVTPDPKLPEDQMAVFRSIENSLRSSPELQRCQVQFYGTLQNEPAYDAIEVLNRSKEVIYSVPRSEFAARSGLWSSDEIEVESAKQKRTVVWDVVVIKPVLMPQERMWRLSKDGFEFSALMQDKALLQAIHDKTLPLQIAEGVVMKVEIEYRESYDGRIWIRDIRSYKIKRLLDPTLGVSPHPIASSDSP